MASHREFQFSWLVTVILIPIQLVMTFMYVHGVGERPMPEGIFLLTTALFAAVFLTFYGMTTTVDGERITLSFGIGWLKMKFALSRIVSVHPVKTPWYYGYGIRLIPHGWMYNVSGPDSVELTFSDTRRIVRVGTQDPVTLKHEIEARLKMRKAT